MDSAHSSQASEFCRITKIKIYKALKSLIVTLKQNDITNLSVFERRFLRNIVGLAQESYERWRNKMNN